MRYGTSLPWTDDELDILAKCVQDFKKTFTETFASFHPTQVSIVRFHVLDHMVEDISKTGGLLHNDAGPYEASHTALKEHYCRTSRRRSNAMDESLRSLQSENPVAIAQRYLSNHEIRMARIDRRSPDNSDRAPHMVRDGYPISLTILRRVLRDAEPLMEDVQGQQALHTVRPLLEKYGERYVSLL